MEKFLIDIIPEIRKTGKYKVDDKNMKKIKKLNTKINNYKEEFENEKEYEYEKSDNGYLYIRSDNRIKNGKKILCYKIGFTKNMKNRMKNYKVGNFYNRLLCYIPLKIDPKTIEKCLKDNLKPHLHKILTDTICYIKLDKLKEEIIDCINFKIKHICNCMICKKKYSTSNIHKHKCNEINTEHIINL